MLLKKQVIWAARNPKKARYIIAILQISVGVLGFVTGLMLNSTNIFLGRYFTWIFALTAIIGIVIYPFDKRLKREAFFFERVFKRKLIGDLLVLTSFFMVMMSVPSLYKADLIYYKPFVSKVYAEKKVNTETVSKEMSFQDFQQKIKKSFVFSSKNHKPLISNYGKFLLILIIVLVSLALLYVIAILACAIACSDLAVLAIIVAIGGLAGIVLLDITLIRKVIRAGKQTSNLTPEKPEQPTVPESIENPPKNPENTEEPKTQPPETDEINKKEEVDPPKK